MPARAAGSPRSWVVHTEPVTPTGSGSSRFLMRYMWLSLAAAVVTIGLKVLAAVITGSVGFLSDAMESGVNLVAAVVGLSALAVAARPPDTTHEFGHGKAEYLSAGVEGALVFVASGAILWTSIARLIHPSPLEQVGWGLALSTGASLLNLGAGILLVRAGRRHRSMAVEADGKHLLTDVWTTGGVLVGVGAVALTGWLVLDPLVAIAVAINIVWAGGRILRDSVAGLMDAALPASEQRVLHELLAGYAAEGIEYHALRTRRAGAHRFVSVHVLVPGDWSVQQGHDLLERIESDVRRALPPVTVLTHLEPLGDPAAMGDQDHG